MDSDAPPDDSVAPKTENEDCGKKTPDRPSPYRHKSNPTVSAKPRPPLPAKPRPPLPKKPPIAHVKPIANSDKVAGNQKKSPLTRLDSTGKGKAPPPPPPATPAPRLPPKDCPPLLPSSESFVSSTTDTDSTTLNSGPSPSKTLSFPKYNIQTKILNSARQKKDEAVSPCKPAPKQPVKPSISLITHPPNAVVGSKANIDSSTDFISEKHMKNKSNSNLHENLGLKQQLNQSESDVEKNRPSSLVSSNRSSQPPPPLKPKPKPRERPVPQRRLSVRNSSDSIGEPKPSPPKPLPPPPPPPIPKSAPPLPNSNSVDTNNNNADSDCTNNDLSSDEDSWLDFKHDSLSLRSLENAVLSITGWHENNRAESPSSPEVTPRRPPIPVRDYKLRSPSIDRSRSSVSESSVTTTTATTTVRSRSRSEIRSNLDRVPLQLPRKSRTSTASGLFSDVLNHNLDTSRAPIRPPRPKHEEIKRTKSKLTASDIQFVHVDFTSSQQAQKLGAPVLSQQRSETRKLCPPKPQRKSLVRRSCSDATDLRERSNYDIESENISQKVSILPSSPPSSPALEHSDPLSKVPIPPPPKRWYPPQSNNSDDKLSFDNFTSISDDHDYHEIMERRLFNSATQSVDYPQTVPEKSKAPTPPPLLPPRNYEKDEDAADSAVSPNPPLPDRNYLDNSKTILSLQSSVQKHYVEMTNTNGIDKSVLNLNDSNHDSSVSHIRPLSSVSQSSLPSDSGSGSIDAGNTNLVLTSGSESSEEETESENDKRKRNTKKVFYIAREIVLSERVFVNILRLLNVDFRKAISDATEKIGRPVIPTDMLNRILDYLPQLQNFNEVLLHDLEERLKEWDKVQKIADIFVKKGPFLKLYASYISNFENTQTLFDECCKKYPSFANVVKEFQASPACGNLTIKHHMLKPIQRNPQYRLLLTDYLRYLEPDSPDYKNAQTALNIVSDVSNHANESIRQEDYIQKLMDIQYSLIGEFEVIKPGRKLVKMGELQKLSRKEMQPRVFILFNDTLLYTTPVAGGYKLNNVLKLAGMKVETPTLEDFKNEFSIISIQRSFTVCANTSLERDEWIEAFAKAIEENNLKRNSFEVNRTLVAALEKGFVLGAKAPLWVPDARVTMCMLCTCGFTFTWRRHHCRACGRVVCGNCSNNKAPLHYRENKSNRVCDECYKILQDEVYTQLKQVKTAKEKGENLEFPVPPETLLSRFEKIRKSGRSKTSIHRPPWLKEVHANDQGSTMSGYLKIYKGKRWKRLWFVLKDKVLYKYKASEDMAAISSTPLLGYEVKRFTEWFEGVEQGLVFELTHTGMPPMRFQTDSATATEKWVTVMREASVP